MRRTRDFFPTGRVYLHSSTGPPFGKLDTSVFLPQLDSWADYVLKAEGIMMNSWSDPYLLYVARGYKISNTIATLKVSTRKGDTFLVNGQPPTLSELLNGLLNLNMRERIVAYPSGGWPTAASMAPEWPAYRAKIKDMKSKWEAGLLP
jgi:hypothetical protein